MARLIERRLLSSTASTKRVYHLAFAIDPQKIIYEPGDTLAVFPENPLDTVKQILPHIKDGEIFIDDLQKRYCIQHLTEQCRLTCFPDGPEHASLRELCEQFPSVRLDGATLLSLLKPLRPRLYSVTLSQKLFPDQIQLIVSEVAYTNASGGKTYGVASHYLCQTLAVGDEARVAVIRSKFKLPQNPAAIIMVGPGTGIAPFRSFLQERSVEKVGPNWLFFGEQHRSEHFYYQQELEAWQKAGILTHLDVAFSRDQDYKIYVQDRMREHAEELWTWIDRGAYIYVCGDASRMAVDVEAQLLAIVQEHVSDPELYLKQLKQTGRYQRDVY